MNHNAKKVKRQIGIIAFLLVLRLGSEIYYQPQIVSNQPVDSLLYDFATINFAHMAIFMFIFSVSLCVIVSLSTTPPDYKLIEGLSFGTLTPKHKNDLKGSYDKIDVILLNLYQLLFINLVKYNEFMSSL